MITDFELAAIQDQRRRDIQALHAARNAMSADVRSSKTSAIPPGTQEVATNSRRGWLRLRRGTRRPLALSDG